MSESPALGGKNSFGTAALVLGIAGLLGGVVIPLVWLLSVAAIVFGSLGLKRAARGDATNATVARWGFWLGIGGTSLFVVLTILVLYLAA